MLNHHFNKNAFQPKVATHIKRRPWEAQRQDILYNFYLSTYNPLNLCVRRLSQSANRKGNCNYTNLHMQQLPYSPYKIKLNHTDST